MAEVEDRVVMSQRELKRVSVIGRVVARELRQVRAAEVLGLSTRQVRRMVRRVGAEGARGLVHRARGRPSNRRLSEELRERVLRLYLRAYQGFGPTLAAEKLAEREGIQLSRQTVRNWLVAAGLWSGSRKRRQHRQWRERKHCCGELVQLDGSHHDWLEGRGPTCVLMALIDDATNRVWARFYPYEGSLPALDSFRRYLRQYGIPVSVYLDRHTTYCSPAKPSVEDELADRRPQSQFERALAELGVTVIHAHSAPAKGRVERLFGTFQDRLVKELRLRGIGTIPAANRFLDSYLPGFNRRFSVVSFSPTDLHRPLPAELDLAALLAVKTERSLRNDSTIVHEQQWYQVLDQVSGRRVMIEERTTGKVLITYRGRALRYRRLPGPPAKASAPVPQPPQRRRWRPPIPGKNHPWRRLNLPTTYRTSRVSSAMTTKPVADSQEPVPLPT